MIDLADDKSKLEQIVVANKPVSQLVLIKIYVGIWLRQATLTLPPPPPPPPYKMAAILADNTFKCFFFN